MQEVQACSPRANVIERATCRRPPGNTRLEAYMSIAERPVLSEELITALRGVSLFSKLDDDATECLQALSEGRELRFRPTERIVDEGDPAALYVVLEGDFQ